MLYRDIRVVYFKNHLEHINTIFGENAEFILSNLTYLHETLGFIALMMTSERSIQSVYLSSDRS